MTYHYQQIIGRLIQARKQAGLSMTRVAKMLDISRSTLWRYETRGPFLSLLTFTKLAAIYDVSEYWLLTGTNPELDESALLEMAQTTRIAANDLDRVVQLLKSLKQDTPT